MFGPKVNLCYVWYYAIINRKKTIKTEMRRSSEVRREAAEIGYRLVRFSKRYGKMARIMFGLKGL